MSNQIQKKEEFFIFYRWEYSTTNGGTVHHSKVYIHVQPANPEDFGAAWTLETFNSEREMQERISELEKQEC